MANGKCAMSADFILRRGVSNRGLGKLILFICERERHEAELAEFHKKYVRKTNAV